METCFRVAVAAVATAAVVLSNNDSISFRVCAIKAGGAAAKLLEFHNMEK